MLNQHPSRDARMRNRAALLTHSTVYRFAGQLLASSRKNHPLAPKRTEYSTRGENLREIDRIRHQPALSGSLDAKEGRALRGISLIRRLYLNSTDLVADRGLPNWPGIKGKSSGLGLQGTPRVYP
jgi:hypothetical protein